MEHIELTAPNDAPTLKLKAIAKCALAVGAKTYLYTVRDETAIHVSFPGAADITHFDPIDNTMHALELLHVARRYGFVAPSMGDIPLCVRVIWSIEDVRVQVGAMRWHRSDTIASGIAFRHALTDAFSAYYDATLDA